MCATFTTIRNFCVYDFTTINLATFATFTTFGTFKSLTLLFAKPNPHKKGPVFGQKRRNTLGDRSHLSSRRQIERLKRHQKPQKAHRGVLLSFWGVCMSKEKAPHRGAQRRFSSRRKHGRDAKGKRKPPRFRGGCFLFCGFALDGESSFWIYLVY